MGNSYVNSICYEIELTAKYLRLMGTQFFEKLDLGLNLDEFAAIDTLIYNAEICQRDLAKMILKDRANTGKLLTTLEKKGLIERKVKTRNNRLIKMISITEAGKSLHENVIKILRPRYEALEAKIGKEQELIKEMLRNFRRHLSDTVETQI